MADDNYEIFFNFEIGAKCNNNSSLCRAKLCNFQPKMIEGSVNGSHYGTLRVDDAFLSHNNDSLTHLLEEKLDLYARSNPPLEVPNSVLQQFESLLDRNMQLERKASTSFSVWSFTQGFIIGQISIIILFLLFLKYFIFADDTNETRRNPPVARSLNSDTASTDVKMKKITEQLTNSVISFSTILKRGGEEVKTLTIDNGMLKNSNNSENEKMSQIDLVLEKTSYNVKEHEPESLDWFNVLVAQIIEQFREEAVNKNNIINSLNKFLDTNSINLPDYLDTIKINELDIGDNYPIFSNCRIENEKGKLEAKINIDLCDRIALGTETQLLLNYPKPRFAALPIKLTVAIVKFKGLLTVSFTKTSEFVKNDQCNDIESTEKNEDDDDEEAKDNDYHLIFSFSPQYTMEFETSSLIGSKSKLENIPKIASMVEYQIKKWFVERCVEPRFQFVKLPNIWPRSKNVRQEKNEFINENITT